LFSSIDSQLYWFKNNFTLHRALDVWLIYFMALIDSQSEQEAKNICQRFVLRKGEEKRILSYFGSRSGVVSKLSKAKVLPSTVFHLLEPLSYEVILLIKAGCGNKKVIKHIEDFFHLYNGTDVSVSGHDLNGLGIAPGPHYQKIFSKLLNAKLNGKVKTKREELEFAAKLKKH
jgi:tRNA nucleotidyltransferase (CCA-adding enzyme)